MDMKEKEGNSDGIIVTTAGNSAPPPTTPPQVPPPAANKKHRRSWSLFRAALFAVHGGGGGGQPADKMKGPPIHSPAKSSHSIWRSLFCGMRPLLLQQPPQLVKHELRLFHDTALPPPSPSSSDNGMTSRYASAEDLQALDDKGDIKELDQAEEEEEEDSTIDVRAEEFIARFYEQMRLQRSGSCSSDQDH